MVKGLKRLWKRGGGGRGEVNWGLKTLHAYMTQRIQVYRNYCMHGSKEKGVRGLPVGRCLLVLGCFFWRCIH